MISATAQENEAYYPTIGLNATADLQIRFGTSDFLFDLSSLPERLTPAFAALETFDIQTSNITILFLSNNDDDQTEKENQKTALQQSASNALTKFKYQSFFTDGTSEIAVDFRTRFLISRTPLLVALDLAKDKKYVLPEDTPITTENAGNFLELIEAGKVIPFIKSAPRPPNDRYPPHPSLVQVVALSFEELVINSSKDVFVEFFTPWYGTCVTIAPTIALLADVFEDNDNIVIAKLDCHENDVDRAYLPEGTYFMMKFFHKTPPIDYIGTTYPQDFLEFIHSHATVKFDLPAAIAKVEKLVEQEKKMLESANS